MQYQELPRIDFTALDGWGRWLTPALIAGAGLTAAVLLLLAGQPMIAGIAFIGSLGAAAVVYLRDSPARGVIEPLVAGPDYSVVGSVLGLCQEPAALTTGEGSLLIANTAYREHFGGARPPLELGTDKDGRQALAMARAMAWRDGGGCVTGVKTKSGKAAVEVERVGSHGDLLLWRFPRPAAPEPLSVAAKWLSGATGERLGAAGILAALVGEDGKILASNRLFAERALDADANPAEHRFSDLVDVGEDNLVRLVAEGEAAHPMRLVYVPVDPRKSGTVGTFMLFEGSDSTGPTDAAHLQALLDVLPVGLALVDRDGRFLTMNQAFRAAAGMKGAATPIYPGDLVVKEDKAAVADAVRRNARGPAMSGDLAVRLARQPAEPVALTLAGLRGLGDAAVLLLLKDNSEEDAGRRTARRRRRPRLQQYPDGDHRPLRPDADAPHAGRQRL
jgi:two-component system cell cycle sensor histidine kinase/response regulator CckA